MKTLVIGASAKPYRYSNRALKMLRDHDHEVVAIGLRKAQVGDVTIGTEKVLFPEIDTVTLYLNPTNQVPYYDYIINLKPRRVIFNPGTENPAFYKTLQEYGIAVEEACTLVLLTTNQY